MTAISPRPACWRAVVNAERRTGRGSVLGPDTSRRARWWELELECGHKACRTVRYKPSEDPQRGGTQRRDIDDALPAPKRVRCEECEAAAARQGGYGMFGRTGSRTGAMASQGPSCPGEVRSDRGFELAAAAANAVTAAPAHRPTCSLPRAC